MVLDLLLGRSLERDGNGLGEEGPHVFEQLVRVVGVS